LYHWVFMGVHGFLFVSLLLCSELGKYSNI
jgi:hypothetical protein